MSNPLLAQENFEDHLQDYTFSRVTLYKLLESGMGSLESLRDLAMESENPRAFEVYSGFMKNMADINDKLMDAQAKNFELLEKRSKKDPDLIEGDVKTIDSIVFSGETADVLKLIETKDRDENETESS